MSSKGGRNAFYYFMLDFKNRPGQKLKTMREAAEAAGPYWASMTKAQRQKYELQAKSFKESKLNCDNQPIDEVEHMERQAITAKQQMRDDIQASLSIAKRTNMLKSHMFFIVHVNSFCQHEHTKLYSPCEIAIAGFSLKDGVLTENIYHAMVEPGSLPFGYASIASTHSKETHQIELPLFGDDVEDNQEEIFDEIFDFLTSKKREGCSSLPTLYAADKDLPMVTSVFEMWCTNYGRDKKLFQIYNLQCMFRILRNMVANNDECWASDTMSYQEIEKDVYSYTFDIACEYHQMADVLVFCSRSIVIRYAYVICDHCCSDADIEMIPGYHVPQNAKICTNSQWKSVKSSKKSISSKSTSEGSIREDTTDAETVISLGKSSSGWEETSSATSINFPELRRPGKMSGNSFFARTGNATGSYAGATSMNTGSAKYGKGSDPTTYALSEDFANLTSQDTMDNHFPAIGAGRGRNFMYKGQGRGNLFKKPPPAS